MSKKVIANTKQYLNWFRHSAPYINAYRGKIFVIMLPGEALAHENFPHIIHDLTLLNSLGIKLVLVHGARPQIEAALNSNNLNPELHSEVQSNIHTDLRITDSESLEYIKQVVGKLRIDIEARFSMGLINSPMHGANINISSGNYIIAKPYGIHHGIDYCHTGEVRKVDSDAIRQQLENDNIVLLSTIGYSASGEVFNLTVEEVASATAISLQADKFIIYNKNTGILDVNQKLINKLSADDAQEIINNSSTQIFNEQLRILELSIKACQAKINRSQVISYCEDGALLIELFTRDGSGTLITQESYEQIRAATINDVGGILELIYPLENEGALVHRSRELLETEISNFSVIEMEGTIISCAALYPQDQNSGELACVATHIEYRNCNRAQLLLERIEQQAKDLGLTQLFVLTTKSPHWFLERGFIENDVNTLPDERKNLYNYQRNSKIFIKPLFIKPL